jgi:hypothetical protein
MEEIVKDLEKACEELELLTEVTKRAHGDASRITELLLYKKIEDGYISNFHKANLYQLNLMKSSFRFRYYKDEVMRNLIDAAIVKVTRREKLKKIDLV